MLVVHYEDNPRLIIKNLRSCLARFDKDIGQVDCHIHYPGKVEIYVEVVEPQNIKEIIEACETYRNDLRQRHGCVLILVSESLGGPYHILSDKTE